MSNEKQLASNKLFDSSPCFDSDYRKLSRIICAYIYIIKPKQDISKYATMGPEKIKSTLYVTLCNFLFQYPSSEIGPRASSFGSCVVIRITPDDMTSICNQTFSYFTKFRINWRFRIGLFRLYPRDRIAVQVQSNP